MSRRKVYPSPEVLGIGGIDIRDGSGSMDNDARIMRVPLIQTPAARHIRAHEMAHAKYSPRKPTAPKGLSTNAVQRAEDMRMNVYSRKQGLHEALDAPTLPPDKVAAVLLASDSKHRARNARTAMAATHNTGDYDAVRKAAKRILGDEFDNTEALVSGLWDDMAGKDAPSWDDTLRAARALMTGEPPEEEGEGEGGHLDAILDLSGDVLEGEGEGGHLDAILDLSGDVLDSLADNKLQKDADELERADMDPFDRGKAVFEQVRESYSYYEGDAAIPPLKVTELPLRQRMAPNKFKTRSKVPADTGRVPRYMHRYCSDKALFAGRGKRRDHGGVVLIDCSGSMALHDKDIDRIMEEAPAGTVATYNGIGMRAELYVVARNGKRAAADAPLRPPHSGNVADVQSLEWMVKRPGPYFWVCDGIVTGGTPRGGERASANIFARCQELLEKHHIIMVRDVNALIDAMRETR